MRDFHRTRHYLAHEMAVLAANALASSRLDNCNSVYRFVMFLHKLQNTPNTLVHTVTNCRKYAYATTILKRLH